MTGPAIEVRGAVLGYDGVPVVEVEHLSIAPGEVVAVVGPNGSGKSTLVKGLLGLNDLIRGEILIDGQPRAQAERLGYVPQRHTLSGSVRATVREIVATGLLARRPWWRPTTARERQTVDEALRVVGLHDRAGDEVSRLSGGQQRRVLVARALATGATTFVMDEPTAGVDAANQMALATTMQRLVDRGATLVIVTHELGPLGGVVSRLVEVTEGRVTFDGTPADHGQLPDHDARHGHGAHHDDEPHPLAGPDRMVAPWEESHA